MLRRLETFARVDGRRLMDIYREDNIENTDYFYPDMKDKVQALARVEQDFLHYLETDFFSKPGNVYWVLEENGVWVSALRLTELSPGDYYLEALSTHPDFRRQGLAAACGAKLILECLERELYPGWDAHDRRSLALAQKLGYQLERSYSAYWVERK